MITVSTGCGDTVLQLGEPYDEVSEFIFDVLASLGWICERVRERSDGDTLDSI